MPNTGPRRLADVFTPELFDSAVLLENTEKLRVLQSGLVTQDALLQEYANSNSKTGTIPVDRDLADEDPDIQSDDPNVEATPSKTTSAEGTWIKNFWHKSWSSMTLARELHHSNIDPLTLISNRASNYWDRQMQKYVANIITGIVADNIGNDDSDMVHDVSTDGSITEQHLPNAENFIAAEGTMGDSIGDLSMVILHSQVFTRLRQLQLIEYVRDADNNTLFPTYQGKTVVVADVQNILTGTNGSNATYDTILCGQGLLGLGIGAPIVPSEVDRDAAKGNGGGLDVLHSRMHPIIHPYGFSYSRPLEGSGAAAGISPTPAEFAEAESWNRIHDRQHIPLVVVRTNNQLISPSSS